MRRIGNYRFADASMRPGQAAPEFPAPLAAELSASECFNEAGAGCPGIPAEPLNEFFKLVVASMRPGQAAPEFDVQAACSGQERRCFNEAGAGCPGILSAG